MSPEQWQIAKRLFNAAIDAPLAERASVFQIERDAEVLAAVEQMLDAADADDFDETPMVNLAHLWQESDESETENFAGKIVGGYKIIRELGRGGMGVVFEAARETQDFSQTVALKLLKKGMDSAAMLRRFRSERRILASLEHPNIARLLDGGASESGLPFFALELVEGEPLDRYCRARNLTVNERLRLFRKICAAVSFAHSRLVVHRDLKPTNILVTKDGEPKLLDFGIAKILSDESDSVAATVTKLGMMTPQYASPEQARGEMVTTASDVYSLGLILYELLTNRAAYEFASRRPDEIARVICEVEPKQPSSVVTSDVEKRKTGVGKTANAKDATATNKNYAWHQTAKSSVQNPRLLRGDLDNIVLKALRKEPNRRYASVEQFSEDVRRHLEGLPVTARRDTFSYRAEKFVKRNSASVIAAALILTSLLAGICGVGWQYVRAERERKLADERFGEVRELANNVVFKYHDAIANLKGSTEVRQMLVADATKYLDRLSQDAGEDENLQNELALAYAKLADVEGKPYYANTGDTSGALENYKKSVNLLEKLTKSKDAAISANAEEELITTLHSRSALDSRLFNFDEAVFLQKKALDLAGARLGRDAQNIQKKFAFARANLWLGDAFAESGDFAEAVGVYNETLLSAEEIYQSAPNDADAETILGVLHDRVGRWQMLRAQELARTDYPPEKIAEIYRESFPHLEKALGLFKKVADENPDNQKYQRNVRDAQSNFAAILRFVGETDCALEIMRAVAAQSSENLKSDAADRQLETDYAEDLHQLALAESAKNQFAAAVEDLQSSIKVFDELIAADSGDMQLRLGRLNAVSDYGDLLLKKNGFGSALKFYQTNFEQISEDAAFPEGALKSFAEGLTANKIGDCYARLADASEIERNSNLKMSENYYRQALKFWQSPEVKREFLSRTPETLEYLNRKLRLSL